MCSDDKYTLINIEPSETNKRISSDICVIIDISGSMNSKALTKSNTGDEED